eukprot:Phypoly_transcript_28316.p1 GENE.Phypoly_transcript_28316~~Phypoly_transcript_28316.p1  ORF type:complete len:104 (+),score=23.89 Phypoly_transcript_28316:121-432(+)
MIPLGDMKICNVSCWLTSLYLGDSKGQLINYYFDEIYLVNTNPPTPLPTPQPTPSPTTPPTPSPSSSAPSSSAPSSTTSPHSSGIRIAVHSVFFLAGFFFACL